MASRMGYILQEELGIFFYFPSTLTILDRSGLNRAEFGHSVSAHEIGRGC